MAAYLKLFKFRYQVTFPVVMFGAYSFSPGPSLSLAWSLLLLYLSFNLFLYGGIYTLNDVADVESDRRHVRKRNRPVASGAISVRAGLLFGLVLVLLGFGTSFWLFGIKLFAIFLGFAALNALYSLHARSVPYLDLVVNASTYPLRYYMGAAVFGGQPPLEEIVAVFFVAFGIVCLRRRIEMDDEGAEARITLRHYSKGELQLLEVLAFGLLLILSVWKMPTPTALFPTAIPLYVVTVFGTYVFARPRHLLRTIWVV